MQTNRHAGRHTNRKYRIRRQTVMQAYLPEDHVHICRQTVMQAHIPIGSTGICRQTVMQEDICTGSTGQTDKPSCRQTDLTEGQYVYVQINNNQQCTQTELPEVQYLYMQRSAGRRTYGKYTVCTNAYRTCRKTALQVETKTILKNESNPAGPMRAFVDQTMDIQDEIDRQLLRSQTNTNTVVC